MLEIITPAPSFDLCSVDAVNAELGLQNDTNSDAMIAGYIAAASDAISRYCRRVFAAQEYAETFWPAHHRHELLLARYPIAEVASVVENGVTLAAEDAMVNADCGALIRLRDGIRVLWPAHREIVITYTAGYSDDTTGAPSLPLALERAAVMLAATFQRERNRDPAIREIQSGDNRVAYGLGPLAGNGLPAEVTALLQAYRDYRLR